ncbi:hypothetical protein EV672_10570 [Aquabacterium commune]|uniref:Secreted protein with PEP-CTERM sorting signal n=1 Tax=Aquabacterium commune TaxID=70586 RepID=A0A4R6R9Y6_9BURK|nr:hypothetical protein [Aquabacterium commune]TDP82883.1 hypothetical protein EV672_10570 [Aquabacterium commune]
MHARPRAVLAMAAALASFTALSTVATPAQAAFQLSNVGLQCSESLVVQEGDAYVLSCVGDLNVQGLGGTGSFQADTSITLTATGNLSLLDVVLRAPNIVLTGGSSVTVDIGVTLDGGDVQLTATGVTTPREGGGIVISNGGSLGSNDPRLGGGVLTTVGSVVPEASSFAMMASGLIALLGLLGVTRRTRP